MEMTKEMIINIAMIFWGITCTWFDTVVPMPRWVRVFFIWLVVFLAFVVGGLG